MAKLTEISWKILEDGTVEIETGDLSGPHHLDADDLLKELAQLLGGEVKIKKRDRLHAHADLSGALKAHTHDGHTHEH